MIVITDEGHIAKLVRLLPELDSTKKGEDGKSWRPIDKLELKHEDGSATQVLIGDFSYMIERRGSFFISQEFLKYFGELALSASD